MTDADQQIRLLMDRALAAHLAGQSAAAEAGYLEVLGRQADHADALHLLGMLALGQNRPARTVELLERALQTDTPTGDMHNTLGIALRALGRLDDALGQFVLASSKRPGLAVAWVNRGGTLLDRGRAEEAIACFRRCLALAPDLADAQYGLSLALQRADRSEEAQTTDRGLAQQSRPHEPGPRPTKPVCDAMSAIANNDSADAIAMLRQALADDPDLPHGRYHLGLALVHGGELLAAIAAFRRALLVDRDHLDSKIELLRAHLDLPPGTEPRETYAALLVETDTLCRGHPDSAMLHFIHGGLLRWLDRPEEAEAAMLHAVGLDCDLVPARIALAQMYLARRDSIAVLEHLDALPQRPDDSTRTRRLYATAGLIRSDALVMAHRPQEALATLRAASDLLPADPGIRNNLAVLLAGLGELEEGLAVLRQAIDLSPGSAGLHSNLIFFLELAAHADEAANQAERKRWYDLYGRQHATGIAPYDNDKDGDRKLRVGYVSGDFTNHTAARVIAAVLLNHDPAQFEVVCYANNSAEDKMTARFRAAAQLWRRIDRIDDDEVANLVRQDAIDILVDLSGHSAANRLLVFARKPAPIQITAWGLPRGTGIETIDYIFSDPVLIPRENAGAFSEEVIYLPCWMPFTPLGEDRPLTSLPALQADHVTFGCFNRLEKASDATLRAWGRILNAIPRSRMLLVDDLFLPGTNPAFEARLRASGIPLDRLEIRPRWHERQSYLDGLAELDLALDPFPQGGGVTTFESLWMGVPVIALLGNSASSRGSAAILSGLGLDDCVARTVDEYVDRAVAKATDLPALARQRGELRERLMRGPPGDVVAYTRAVEDAYRAVWRRWCAAAR